MLTRWKNYWEKNWKIGNWKKYYYDCCLLFILFFIYFFVVIIIIVIVIVAMRSVVFFVVFVLVAQFVLVNVVVAVLMKHLEVRHRSSRISKTTPQRPQCPANAQLNKAFVDIKLCPPLFCPLLGDLDRTTPYSRRLCLAIMHKRDAIHLLTSSVLFCSLAVLEPRVGHTMDILSPFIPVLFHSD